MEKFYKLFIIYLYFILFGKSTDSTNVVKNTFNTLLNGSTNLILTTKNMGPSAKKCHFDRKPILFVISYQF